MDARDRPREREARGNLIGFARGNARDVGTVEFDDERCVRDVREGDGEGDDGERGEGMMVGVWDRARGRWTRRGRRARGTMGGWRFRTCG